jgi:very-short-patch-repair endonuclease
MFYYLRSPGAFLIDFINHAHQGDKRKDIARTKFISPAEGWRTIIEFRRKNLKQSDGNVSVHE